MLNSILAMCNKLLVRAFSYLILLLGLIAANTLQTSVGINIQSPHAGEAVQGLVQITGNTSIYGFISYELAFSFDLDQTETWFLIEQGNAPVNNGVLGEWDTSTLTDGNYNLRLIVNRIEYSPIIVFIEGIRVRNYSPVETETPSATSDVISKNLNDSSLKTASSITASKLQFTPTPLKKNPAEINPSQIDLYIKRGAIFALVVLGFLGLYIVLRRQ